MAIVKNLDTVLDSKSKIAVVRLFIFKTPQFKATGREIAKLIKFSPPATHAALKDLFNYGILQLDVIGKQHIYRLDANNRVVKKILRPMFKEEVAIKDEIKKFLVGQISVAGIKNRVLSLILYGSLQRNESSDRSDVDVAVVIKDKKDKEEVENKFLDAIAVRFKEYFNAHLDVYIKARGEFRQMLKKNLPPVSTLMKSYSVIYGKEPLEI